MMMRLTTVNAKLDLTLEWTTHAMFFIHSIKRTFISHRANTLMPYVVVTSSWSCLSRSSECSH